MEDKAKAKAEERLAGLRLTATRLALFERKIGKPLTKMTDNDLGMVSFIAILECAGLTEDEINDTYDALGAEDFSKACVEVLINSGLFNQAKTSKKVIPAPKSAR